MSAVPSRVARRAVRRQRRVLAVGGLAATGAVGAAVAAGVLLADRTPWLALAPALILAVLPAAAAGLPVGTVRRVAPPVLRLAATVTVLAAAVLAGLATLVLVLGRLPHGSERALVTPASAGLLLGAALSAAGVPAALRLVRRAERSGRHTPQDVLTSLAARHGQAVPLEERLQQLADALRETYGLDVAEVWRGDGTVLQRAAVAPSAAASGTTGLLGAREVAVLCRVDLAGDGWLRQWLPGLLKGRDGLQLRAVPAAHAGTVHGLLLVARASSAPRFSERDERALVDLARRLGVLLHNSVLDTALTATLEDLRAVNGDLRRSRARLVSAADAERRRIERDLHDGAQQHLVALAVTLGLARDLVTADPAGAVDLLEEAVVEIKTTVQQVRDLAHGIYPPLLAEAGLAAALRAAATRAPQPVVVTVEPRDLPRQPAPVEEAVYFCCLEALQNAAKHAPGAEVSLRLEARDDVLRFEVADEGPGFNAALVQPGHGFANMADRLGAIGGRVSWRSSPGAGAVVSGDVPVGAETSRQVPADA